MQNVKLQLTEFCQKCQNTQNIKGTIATRSEKYSDGETKTIITVSYHCEACNTFVRSEEFESKEKDSITT